LTTSRSQRLGRLATVDGSGAPQNNPVGFFIDEASSQVFIRGFNLGPEPEVPQPDRQPERRVRRRRPRVGGSLDARGVEMRGWGEALTDADPPVPGFSRELIRITPAWIASCLAWSRERRTG